MEFLWLLADRWVGFHWLSLREPREGNINMHTDYSGSSKPLLLSSAFLAPCPHITSSSCPHLWPSQKTGVFFLLACSDFLHSTWFYQFSPFATVLNRFIFHPWKPPFALCPWSLILLRPVVPCSMPSSSLILPFNIPPCLSTHQAFHRVIKSFPHRL